MDDRIKVALCEGRHDIPDATDGYIFGQTLDPTDVCGLEDQAYTRLRELAEDRGLHWRKILIDPIPGQADYTDIYAYRYDGTLVIYVTGLTVALVSAINSARYLFRNVVLMHYNCENGIYYAQGVAL